MLHKWSLCVSPVMKSWLACCPMSAGIVYSLHDPDEDKHLQNTEWMLHKYSEVKKYLSTKWKYFAPLAKTSHLQYSQYWVIRIRNQSRTKNIFFKNGGKHYFIVTKTWVQSMQNTTWWVMLPDMIWTFKKQAGVSPLWCLAIHRFTYFCNMKYITVCNHIHYTVCNIKPL